MKRLKKHQKAGMARTLRRDQYPHDYVEYMRRTALAGLVCPDELILLLKQFKLLPGNATLNGHNHVDKHEAGFMPSHKILLTPNAAPPRRLILPGPPIRAKEMSYPREKNWARKKRRYRGPVRNACMGRWPSPCPFSFTQ